MGIHFILLFVIFILTLIYRVLRDRKKTKKANIFLLLIFLILILFIGLRNITIGTDTVNYVSAFWRKDFSFSNFEIIFPLLIRIIRFFTDKYFIYLSIIAAITLYGIYYSTKKYKFDSEFFLFLYITSFCYLYSTSATRFFCAFSIILVSFNYMIKKEDIKVLLLIIIATMFHTSALVFIPVYYFSKIKYNKINIIFMIIILSFVVLLNITLGNTFIFNIDLFSKYSYIIENQNSLGGLATLMNIGILIFGLVYYKSITIYKEEYEFFLKMQLVSTAVDFIGIAYRLIWFFRFPVWFIIPIILINLKSKKSKDYFIIYFVFIVIYLILYYYYLSNSYSSHNFLNYLFNNLFK